MTTTPSSIRCRNCSWCVLEDYGYSNYTTEGTHQGCMLKLNPDFPLDDSYYGETSENEFALRCTRYKPGGAIHIDVNREDGDPENYIEDKEILAYWLLIKPDDTYSFANIIDTIYTQ